MSSPLSLMTRSDLEVQLGASALPEQILAPSNTLDESNAASLNPENVAHSLDRAELPNQATDDIIPSHPPLAVASCMLSFGSPLTTPFQEPPELKRMAGNILAVSPPCTLQSSTLKANPSLRLPPFEMLGIANPHPDQPRSHIHGSISPVGAGPLSKPEDPLHCSSPQAARSRDYFGADITATAATAEQNLPQLTPPYEAGVVNWSSVSGAYTASAHASAPTDPATPAISADGNNASTSGPPPPQTVSNEPKSPRDRGWIEELLDLLKSKLQDGSVVIDNNFKILTHALPCPSTTGHAFQAIISEVRSLTPSSQTNWINVTHAVPGRFAISEAPTSPPTTPNLAVAGDDYFTTQVFDSVIPMVDYQAALPVERVPSPMPAVTPLSINLSIVERYIPPSREIEFDHIFSPTAPRSLLLDRLVELSPRGGMLVFVYPTKSGAQSFMQQHLDPVLAPILRETQVLHGLSGDFGNFLGQMASIKHMLEFADAHSKLQSLVNHLNTQNHPLDRYHRQPARLKVLYAGKREVQLSRKEWAEWWNKQERDRIQPYVDAYLRRPKPAELMKKVLHRMINRSGQEDDSAEITPAAVVQQLLDGVANRPYPKDENGKEKLPMSGVEIGVFVIQKTEQSVERP